MKNLKEKIISIGGTFKNGRKVEYFDSFIPHFKIKTCEGKGDPNECSATKLHHRQAKTQRWKTNCLRCRKKWIV